MNMQKRRKMLAAVNQLIIDRTFSVARKGKDIMLIKIVAKRPVSIFLRDMGDGYWVEPPKQEFSCRCSHFEFIEREQRYTRRKSLLMQLVDRLKKTEVWEFILNKTFFIPNPDNPRMNKKIVSSQYRTIMGGSIAQIAESNRGDDDKGA